MREEFQPFEDCTPQKSGGRNAISVLWVAEAVQLIVALTYAYSTMKGNSADLAAMLGEIQKKLDEIRRELVEINRKVDLVIDLLQDMPRIIRGEVESAMIRATLGEAKQTVAIIQGYIEPDKIDQNLDRTQQQLDDLQKMLGRITGLKGLSGILVVAPFLPAWLAGSAAVQKARKRKDPNWNVESPWKKSFMLECQAIFGEFFDQCEFQDAEYNAIVIPHFPPHNIPLIIRNDELSPRKLGDISVTDYRVCCPSVDGGERLQTKSLLIPDKWHDIDPNQETRAQAAYSRFLLKRAEVTSFYEIVPKVYKDRQNILEAFVEPTGFWDVNN